MACWFVGTIGFSYKDWVGEFYPPGMPQRDYLHYYCKVFNAVEIDSTFHSIPQPSAVQSWSSIAPQDFKFCVKTPRVITHDMGLKDSQGLMDDFIETLTPLKDKTGPILIQLPPSYSQDNLPVLAAFLAGLPASHRYAVEFRHPSWYNKKTEQLLTQHRICWVSIDYPHLPKQICRTTDFLYIRWIGVNNLYHHHSYERVDKTEILKAWIQEITPHLDDVSGVYGFFNNDYAGFAPGTANRFKEIVGLPREPLQASQQPRLF